MRLLLSQEFGGCKHTLLVQDEDISTVKVDGVGGTKPGH